MIAIDYQNNLCIDTPDKRDYPAGEYLEQAMGLETFKRPEEVIVQNQGQTPACTRFSSVVGNNGQNILEYKKNGQEYEQLNPMDVWNRGNKQLTLTSALVQLKTEGLIEGWVAVPRYPQDKAQAILQMKQAIDLGNYIFTGSDNGDRGKTGKKPYTYRLRTDGRIVGHARLICAYDDTTQMFKVINSRGEGRGDKGYFYLPYELIDKIFTKYCLIDKDNQDIFKKFKAKQKAIQLTLSLSEFWKFEIDSGTQAMLHNLAERLRQEYQFK